MKIAFIGCVQFSFTTLQHLLSLKKLNIKILAIITKTNSHLNADFTSLVPLAEKNNIPYFIVEGNDQKSMLNCLKNLSLDVIYCFGWSYLLKKAIIRLPRIGVIGYHPAVLPQNRGRHPIIWALALGLQETASTFFFMNEDADSGDILNQQHFPILSSDNANTLYQKFMKRACKQISQFTPQLVSGNFKRRAQDHSKANYWRKRNKIDGEIDWRMTAEGIHNLVRALTKPYEGAHFNCNGEEFKIWKTELVNEITEMKNIEPGKIFESKGHEITVKCGNGLLRLIEHDCHLPLKSGDYF